MIKPIFKKMNLQAQISTIFFSSIAFIVLFSFIFFITMSSILQENEQVYMNNIMKQVMEKITGTAEDTERFAQLIANNQYTQAVLTEKDPYENYKNARVLLSIMPGVAANNRSISNILILDLHDVFIGVNGRNYSIIEQLDRDFHIFSPDEYPETFSGLILNDYDGNYYYAYMKPIFNTSVGSLPYKKIGTCVFLNTTSSLQDSINQISMPLNSKFIVMNDLNQIIVSNSKDISQDISNTINEIMQSLKSEERSLIENIDGEKCLVQYQTISSTGWKILSIIPVSEINADLNRIIKYSSFFIIAVTVLFLFWRMQMTNSIMHPIRNMITFMSKGGYHSLRNRLEITKNNEIGELAEYINIMLDEIDDLTKKIFVSQSNMYEMELSKKKAELSALQSQINPHFLYNTLESIKGYGYLLGSKEVVEITNSLSFIMRYCIKGSEMVAAKDELNCILKYLNIINIRFENRFTLEILFSDEILELSIPRFILQPIIENAIYHGLEPILNGGKLTVKGYLNKDQLIVFEIHDNGKGIPAASLQKIKSSLQNALPDNVIDTNYDRSIGLINIDTRLKCIYGNKYGLIIESQEAVGTSIYLKMPVLETEKDAAK